MGIASTGSRAACALALAMGMAACSRVGGIDASNVSPISNDDTYATLGYLWSGAQGAIDREREPSASPFTLTLNYQLPCTRGGSGSYQGTLSGTQSGGTGNASLAVTGALAACQFDNTVSVTTISSSGVTVTGTIAMSAGTWGTVNLHMVAPSVTVNGVACPGGVDVTLTGPSLSAQLTSSGTACGRTGDVLLP